MPQSNRMQQQADQMQREEAAAEMVDIPGTALQVSRVALGTWAMGGWMWGGTDERDSVATIRAVLDRGINLIDTAPVYGFGVSEEIVGKAVAPKGLRSRAVIATKVGLEWRDGKVYRNATRDRIMQEVDQSLRRLRTDYIDIYQVHWPDPLVPIEETAEAMRMLHDQGKIRAIGASNFSVAQMERFRQVAPLHDAKRRAEHLGARRLVKRGELPGFKIGGCWRINRASLDKWLSGDITGHP